MKTKLVISQIFFGLISVAAIGAWWQSDIRSTVPQIVADPTREVLTEAKIKRNSTLIETLSGLGVSRQTSSYAIKEARKVYSLRSLRAGTSISIFSTPAPIEEVTRIVIELDAVESILIHRKGASPWVAELEKRPVEIVIDSYQGRVTSSLWGSASDAGMDSSLISDLAEVFAWQLDFSREVQSGDRWRIVVEKKMVGKELVGWGRILSAEYEHAKDTLSAVLFGIKNKDGSDKDEYFFPDGLSLRKMFLKSPIRLARISSRFQRKRFHPILRRNRPHNGVDYAARPGTPVMSVGDGKVEFVGWKGGGGLTVIVRHNSTYKTAYKHLQSYRHGLKRGKMIKQGDIIGAVGATGLATGPHLHFEFYENGRYVDPLGKKFPSADPVPESLREEFTKLAQERLSRLPAWGQGPSLVYQNQE